MPKININNLESFYEFHQTLNSKTLLFLVHGWNELGSSSWQDIADKLATELKIDVITPDMPAFGQSKEPKEIWGVEEYSDWMQEFINQTLEKNSNKYTRIYLAGHSFGGGVSSVVAGSEFSKKLNGLVLLAPAIIREADNQSLSLKKKITKFGKKIFRLPGLNLIFEPIKKTWYKILNSPDYDKTSGIKRQIMQKILTQDLRAILPDITLPTLIIWGDKDKYTPLYQSQIIHQAIPNSRLIVLPKINHGLHLHTKEEVVKAIKNFLEAT